MNTIKKSMMIALIYLAILSLSAAFVQAQMEVPPPDEIINSPDDIIPQIEMAQHETFPVINGKGEVEIRDEHGRYHGKLPGKNYGEVWQNPNGIVVKDQYGRYILFGSKNQRWNGNIPKYEYKRIIPTQTINNLHKKMNNLKKKLTNN